MVQHGLDGFVARVPGKDKQVLPPPVLHQLGEPLLEHVEALDHALHVLRVEGQGFFQLVQQFIGLRFQLIRSSWVLLHLFLKVPTQSHKNLSAWWNLRRSCLRFAEPVAVVFPRPEAYRTPE